MEAQQNHESAGTQESPDLDACLAAYKAKVDEWITAVREEEKLAIPDHSMRDWETWDHAALKEEEAGETAADARHELRLTLAAGKASWKTLRRDSRQSPAMKSIPRTASFESRRSLVMNKLTPECAALARWMASAGETRFTARMRAKCSVVSGVNGINSTRGGRRI